MMPVRPAHTKIRAQAELHARVAASTGFRPRDLKPGESPVEVARLLRSLENRGMVLFVPSAGWVDSSPALRRFLSVNTPPDAVDRLDSFLGLAS